MRHAAFFALLSSLFAPVASAQADPGQLCRSAIARAEREAGIPAGLLQAIGRVESGRRNPETGTISPWPWTQNAEGRGHFLPTREAALAALREMQGRGVRVIDVGCMQVNLHHHPRAFTTPEEAFDPDLNARYTARFLLELHGARPDWMVAAGHYHSHTPDLAQAYRSRVQAAWAERAARAAEDRALAAPRPAPAPRLALSNQAERVQVAAATMPGRGLDAYRAQPVPLAARSLLPVPLAAGLRRQ
ncbi:lytic transglycosylase domain-containing protein [Sabulicella glaciei]|uniref:Lytic transglycosylase domain-containing protein n=1 Tax=Sabulicella glaciei TaxID=2984948 RepID=A0ABT3NQP8_9PROT|nr:lytic transglycosylase domain-containing protein [Roseococcus sp. MDT2-1-1]MCW8084475.1 lytic transglycosylase domain-containing protein [Roseococcus sp. MDT2-1-1]